MIGWIFEGPKPVGLPNLQHPPYFFFAVESALGRRPRRHNPQARLYSYGLYSYGYIVMACIVMACIVMANTTFGCWALNSDGLYSCGRYSHCLYSYGQYDLQMLGLNCVCVRARAPACAYSDSVIPS